MPRGTKFGLMLLAALLLAGGVVGYLVWRQQAGQGPPAGKPSAKTPVEEKAIAASGDVTVEVIEARAGDAGIETFYEAVWVEDARRSNCLVIRIRATNDHSSRIVSWRHLGKWNSRVSGAAIVDEFGNSYRHETTSGQKRFAGQARDTRIDPGKSVEDVLVFEKPLEKAQHFTLTLKGPNDEKISLAFNLTKFKTKEGQKEGIEITADRLAAEFSENEGRATQGYEGKKLIVIGVIEKIEGAALYLKTRSKLPIRCSFSAPGELEGLTTGGSVYVRGICTKQGGLSNCFLLDR